MDRKPVDEILCPLGANLFLAEVIQSSQQGFPSGTLAIQCIGANPQSIKEGYPWMWFMFPIAPVLIDVEILVAVRDRIIEASE